MPTMIKVPVHQIRFGLYCMLFAFAVVATAFCAKRLAYTLDLPSNAQTNNGYPFHDQIVVELLVASVLTTLWAPPIAYMIYSKLGDRFSFAMELVGLAILMPLWLVGAVIATHTSNLPYTNVYWGNLSLCWATYWQCRDLTVMLAFAWASCILVVTLFVVSVWFTIAHKAFYDPVHGRWDHPKLPYYPKY